MSTQETIQRLPLTLINPSPSNYRKTMPPAGLQELADSLRAIGLQQPIVVRPVPTSTGFEVVMGHRRLAAAELAGWDDIPAIVRAMTDAEADVARLHENLSREDVHYVEEADALRRLIEDHGHTAEDLAETTGKGLTWVYSRLKLAKLHPSVRETLLKHPEWSPETLTLVARVPTSLQPQALSRITHGHGEDITLMSYRSARETLRSGYTLQIQAAPWASDAALMQACYTCPKASHKDPAFSDAPEGLCTDPACWAVKGDDYTTATVQRLEAAGRVRQLDDGERNPLANQWERVAGPGGQATHVGKLLEEATAAGLEIPQTAVVMANGKTSIGITTEDAQALSDALARHHGIPTAAEAQAQQGPQTSAADDDEPTATSAYHQALRELPPEQRAVADHETWRHVQASIVERIKAGHTRQRADLVLLLRREADFGDTTEVIRALRDSGASYPNMPELDDDDVDPNEVCSRLITAATSNQRATALMLIALDSYSPPGWLMRTERFDTWEVAARMMLAEDYGIDLAEFVPTDAGTEQTDLFGSADQAETTDTTSGAEA